MKKFIFVFILNLTFGLLHSFAQAPQAIPYQGVARNATGKILATQPISLRLSIHDGTPAGTVVFSEKHSVTTTTLGLFNLNIGTGTAVTGTLSVVNWGTGAKFIQVEMDPTGGTSYTDMGTTQLNSVPYALYAASSGTPAPTGSCSCNYSIGQVVPALGGMIFYLDAAGCHGLVAATTDQSTGIQWYNGDGILCNLYRNNGIYIGRLNTDKIIEAQGVGNYAAQICAQYLGGGFGDWYLPSKYELNLMYTKIGQGSVLGNVGGFADLGYWSSTENNIPDAWLQLFSNGNQTLDLRSFAFYVRAVRAF